MMIVMEMDIAFGRLISTWRILLGRFKLDWIEFLLSCMRIQDYTELLDVMLETVAQELVILLRKLML